MKFNLSLLAALGAALASCAPDGQQAQPQAAETRDAPPDLAERAQDGDCLLMVWSQQDQRDVEFDRANDTVEGGAISCATGTTASRFDRAIVALRTAARAGDKARVLDELGLPLTYIDADGTRRELKDRAAVDAAFDDVFDPAMIDTLSRLDLRDMAVASGGGSFALGTLWLVVDEDGGRPRLVTVNRQALTEAAQTAREKAGRNQGRELPFDE